ncbi:hypothetical protein GGX14DRAFT_639250 [Mycena pura]|uniref:DNA polymerase n=1 Tax=Mycena pura TaxID=153505 RepID=A0AAD6YPT1_9AGAR|nr:hypothetical protein GGX14DRAFT_639250 [Mycena pura]
MASVLQVQINQIDHYMAQPGQLDNSDLPKVPVIRIYGPSSTGKKCCVHVHQVYPYFFVEYDGKLRLHSVNRYISKLTHSLNHAIALSLKKDITTFKHQFIRAITLVKGIHFYGFHSSYSPFLKVYIVDPTVYNRVVTIMRSGTVMKTHYRVFESHLSFTLQFAADFGLYGCGWLNLSEAFQRGRDWEDDYDIHFQMSSHFCQTRMPLEVDVAAFHILNRLQVTARNLHHQLVIPVPPQPPEPLVLSVRELWEDERARRRARGLNPTPDMPVDPSESSRSARTEWVAEARWWDDIRKRIEREKELAVPLQAQKDWEKWVMTAFESVEALWEDSRRTWRPAMSVDPAAVDVDEQEHQNDELDIEVDDSFSADHLSQLVENEANWEMAVERDILLEGDAEDVDNVLQEEHEQPFQIDPEDTLEDKSRLANPSARVMPMRTSSAPELVLSSLLKECSSREPGKMQLIGSPPCSPRRLPLDSHISFASQLSNLPASNGEVGVDDRSVDSNTSPPLKKRRIDFAKDSTHSAYEISRRAMALNTLRLKIINPNRYIYAPEPPSITKLLETMDSHGIPRKIYRAPFYSNDNDVPERPREYGGLLFFPKGNNESLEYLDNWKEKDICPLLPCDAFAARYLQYSGGWEFSGHPPSVRQVKNWLASEPAPCKRSRRQLRSQVRLLIWAIEGPTQANIYGLKTMPAGGAVAVRETQRMTVMSLEVFAPSAKNPVPERDEIVAAFYSFRDVDSAVSSKMVIVNVPSICNPSFRKSEVELVPNELALLNHIVDAVLELDPDIIIGWEIQTASWGYLNERGQRTEMDIIELISRAHEPNNRPKGDDQWGMRHTSTFKVPGRHVLNLWRIMRVELTLNIYTFANVVFDVLGRRTPHYSHATLSEWYQDSVPGHTTTVLRYYANRCTMNLEILEDTEIVSKTASALSAFMFRIAKPESFVLLSPSRHDVGRQNAAEAMPLILEPQSAFYTSPVLVLDFQSLYPSIMIANNFCYSTFLGRVNEFQGRQKFGVTDLDLRPGLVENLRDHITVSPNGMMFVKPEVRAGLLGRMLAELLDTRVMIKQAMKGVKDDKALRKVLDARQLGLKYIANVTYGYTSATLSGRMPAVEIADRQAIMLINTTEKWGAEVVYGDTDSVFVHLPGKTKDQAFRIGYDISETITSRNPYPIKLKFEKVYLPCVLLAKKRYVGFKYESPDETEPGFDAKGIETVRRDGVLAQKKMTETCLKILFRTQNLTEIKDYCYRSWQKLLEGKASVQDFIFAKEVRMGTYRQADEFPFTGGPPPPGAVLAARQAITENAEPQYGERVPYVICRGPNARLVDRVFDPLELLNDCHLHLDADYYISRVLIPPLDRILSLAGADVRKWYIDMPKAKSLDIEVASPSKLRQKEMDDNIHEHFFNYQCLACAAPSDENICDKCYSNTESTMSGLLSKIQLGEKRLLDTSRICWSCTQTPLGEPIECVSLDCLWLYARKRAEERLDILAVLKKPAERLAWSAGQKREYIPHESQEGWNLES